jgi:hypothetical protein
MTRVPTEFPRRRIVTGVGSLAFLVLGGAAARPALGLDPVELNQHTSVPGTDLVLDWRVTYNGAVLSETGFADVGGERPAPVVQLAGLKPGDEGSLTVRASVTAPEDGQSREPVAVSVRLALTETAENGVNEPEAEAGDTTDTVGELQDAIEARVWHDVGAADVAAAGACNGRREPDEPVLAEGTLAAVADELATPVDLDPDPARSCFAPGDSVCLSLSWSLPPSTSNVVQTDSLAFDLAFDAEPCSEREER